MQVTRISPVLWVHVGCFFDDIMNISRADEKKLSITSPLSIFKLFPFHHALFIEAMQFSYNFPD